MNLRDDSIKHLTTVHAEAMDVECARARAAIGTLAGAIPEPSDDAFEHTNSAALVAQVAREFQDISAKLFASASALSTLARLTEERRPELADVVVTLPRAKKAPPLKSSRRKKATRGR